MVNIFAGYDPREADGFHVFIQSVIDNTSMPISIIPVHQSIFRRMARGTNQFGDLRFLIPKVMDYKGMAVWMDGSDMMLRSDVKDLIDLYDPFMAVQVVKHDYKTKSPRKYVGTKMECDNLDYPRKNWSSVMLINCAHKNWFNMNIDDPAIKLHRFEHIEDRFIGELPIEWNHLVGEYPYNPEAKLVHFTLGIPSFYKYAFCDYNMEWDRYSNKICY